MLQKLTLERFVPVVFQGTIFRKLLNCPKASGLMWTQHISSLHHAQVSLGVVHESQPAKPLPKWVTLWGMFQADAIGIEDVLYL